tara:strand:- start:119 stop:433 length:315 start_codon:yes stop_codon:yes gene_type:complete
MAKGKASVSSTGASMSKYDVEVEARLTALEAQAHPTPTGKTQKKVDDRLTALEASIAEIQILVYGNGSSNEGTRLDNLITKLASIPAIASYCDRDEEGNRSLGV